MSFNLLSDAILHDPARMESMRQRLLAQQLGLSSPQPERREEPEKEVDLSKSRVPEEASEIVTSTANDELLQQYQKEGEECSVTLVHNEPLKSQKQSRIDLGLRRLSVLLQSIMLRRTKDAEYKGKRLLDLPPRSVEILSRDFESPQERDFYPCNHPMLVTGRNIVPSQNEPTSTSTSSAHDEDEELAALLSGLSVKLRMIEQAFDRAHRIAALVSGSCMTGVDLLYGTWSQNGSLHEENLGPHLDYSNKLAMAMVLVGVCSFLTNWMFLVLMSSSTYTLSQGLRRAYFSAALVQDPTFYDEQGPGAISTHSNRDVSLIRTGLGEKMGFFLNSIGTLIASITMALCKAPTHGGVLLSLPVFSILVFFGLGILSDKATKAVIQVDSRLSTFMEQVIATVRIVHSFEITQVLLDRIQGLFMKPLSKVVRMRTMVRASELSVMYFVVTVLYAIGFWWGSVQIAKGRESMQGVVTSFFNYLNTLFSLTMVVAHFQSILDCLTTLREMRAVIERQPDIDIRDTRGLILGIPSAKATETDVPTYTPSFKLESVTFAYPSRPFMASLVDVSIDFKPGTVTALVGPSGSGKSTITTLLSREYDPNSSNDTKNQEYPSADVEKAEKRVQGQGRVLYGGVDMRDLNVRWLRSQIAVVRQNPQMFSGSIIENVAMGLSAGIQSDLSVSDPAVREK
ncbi:ABC-type xenobiotic transporter [Malassezia equina]|uniref:ABC-type xenobiotic transporter n=1 Tax=Malassezia equina TaxID=1381935 RepID=A0AAF0ECJ8_9BASI|nr:ABC-type xenobiotic transporter [Malassezia equina]